VVTATVLLPEQGVAFAGILAGVRILSNRRLRCLPCDGFADLTVEIQFDRDRPTGHIESGSHASLRSTVAECHALPEVMGLRGWIESSGRRVTIVEPADAVIDVAWAIRQVLPFASALQGGVILHGSAVLIGGCVHTFIAASGVGKTTLAARLAARGLAIVADDLMPCRKAGEEIRVPLPFAGQAGESTARLGGVHFLSRDSGAARVLVELLSAPECLTGLLVNGFGELCVPAIWAAQFNMYALIARRVPAFSLAVPDDPSRLEDSAAQMLAMLETRTSAAGT
jgi:hypothetical protein